MGSLSCSLSWYKERGTEFLRKIATEKGEKEKKRSQRTHSICILTNVHLFRKCSKCYSQKPSSSILISHRGRSKASGMWFNLSISFSKNTYDKCCILSTPSPYMGILSPVTDLRISQVGKDSQRSLSPTPGFRLPHPTFKPNVWKCCLNTSWTPEAWDHNHCPGQPVPWPAPSGAEPFPNSHLAFSWCSSMPAPRALLLTPESRA